MGEIISTPRRKGQEVNAVGTTAHACDDTAWKLVIGGGELRQRWHSAQSWQHCAIVGPCRVQDIILTRAPQYIVS